MCRNCDVRTILPVECTSEAKIPWQASRVEGLSLNPNRHSIPSENVPGTEHNEHYRTLGGGWNCVVFNDKPVSKSEL